MDAERVNELLAELEDLVGSEPPPEPEGASGAAGTASARASSRAADRALGPEGQEAPEELRRGLQVLDELLEIRPDDLSLRARRIGYLRRLGSGRRCLRQERDLVGRLVDRGARRAARILCLFVAERHPDDDPIREIASSLDPLDGGRSSVPPPSATEWGGISPGGSGARLRSAVEGELEIHAEAAPWLYRARREATTGADDPPVDAYRYYARYLLIKGRTDEATGLLTHVLEAGAHDEEVERAVRADLVECLLAGDRRPEALEHLALLAQRDESFAVVLGAAG